MQNVVRSTKTLTEEELAKLKEVDWDTYYRESAPEELKGLTNCPDCNSILIARDDQPETSCYRCGKKISP
jgi:uncharacterized paraquat-inducible protein A